MNKDTWNAVDAWFEKHLVHQDDALEQAVQATIDADMPQIQVAANQGKQLMLLAMAMQARNVLEIGTLGGFSTIWLARGVPAAPRGRVITLEVSQKHAEVARTNIERAGVLDRVDIRIGPALEHLEAMASESDLPEFDLVFIDADKENVCAYFDHAVRLSRPGAAIVVDNVTRKAEVLDESSDDPRVQAMRDLMARVGADSRVDATAVQTVGGKSYDGYLMAIRTDG